MSAAPINKEIVLYKAEESAIEIEMLPQSENKAGHQTAISILEISNLLTPVVNHWATKGLASVILCSATATASLAKWTGVSMASSKLSSTTCKNILRTGLDDLEKKHALIPPFLKAFILSCATGGGYFCDKVITKNKTQFGPLAAALQSKVLEREVGLMVNSKKPLSKFFESHFPKLGGKGLRTVVVALNTAGAAAIEWKVPNPYLISASLGLLSTVLKHWYNDFNWEHKFEKLNFKLAQTMIRNAVLLALTATGMVLDLTGVTSRTNDNGQTTSVGVGMLMLMLLLASIQKSMTLKQLGLTEDDEEDQTLKPIKTEDRISFKNQLFIGAALMTSISAFEVFREMKMPINPLGIIVSTETAGLVGRWSKNIAGQLENLAPKILAVALAAFALIGCLLVDELTKGSKHETTLYQFAIMIVLGLPQLYLQSWYLNRDTDKAKRKSEKKTAKKAAKVKGIEQSTTVER